MSGSESRGSLVPDVVRRSYSRKLAVVFVLIAALLAVGGTWVFLQTSAAVGEQAEDRLEFSATSQSRELGRVVNLLREESRLLSRSGGVTERPCPAAGECDQVDRFLESELTGDQLPAEVVGVHYVANRTDDPTVYAGQSRNLTDETLTGRTLSDLGAPWSPGDLPPGEDATYVSRPWNLTAGDRTTTVFAVVSRVPGSPGPDLLVILVSTEALSEAMPRPGDDGFTTVVDGSGTVVLSHRQGQVLGSVDEVYTTAPGGDGTDNGTAGNATATATATATAGAGGAAPGSPLAIARGGESGYTVASPAGERVAVGYAPVPGTANAEGESNWVVLAQVPAGEAFAVQDLVRRNLLLLLAGALFAVGAAVFSIGRQTSGVLADLTARAEELRDGDLRTEMETNRIDEFGELYDAFALMRDSLREQILEAREAREEAERRQQQLQEFNDHLEATAEEYGAVMEACADGDLTVRMEPDEQSDAMATVARGFNEMVDRLEATTGRLGEFAADVAAASQQVTASVEEVKGASERVSESTQSISEGAETQREQFRTVQTEIEDLSASTEEIASTSEEVADLADRSTDLGREGRERAEDAVETMTRVAEEADETVARFQRLEEDMEEIAQLTDVISEIADQTNMLALNANIEASRSGSGDGGGFGAVAEEIRDLAGDAKEAADEADELIGGVRERTRETAEVVTRTGEDLQQSADTVENTAEALSRLADHAEKTAVGIREIDRATDVQAEATQEVADLVEDAARISSQTADEAGDVAGAAEEQTSALTAVANSVSDLSEQASDLSRRLETFETRPADERPGHGAGWEDLPEEDDEDDAEDPTDAGDQT